jgi:hypothetical protein
MKPPNHLFDGFNIPLGTNHYLKPLSLLVAHWYNHKMNGLHSGLTRCFLLVPWSCFNFWRWKTLKKNIGMTMWDGKFVATPPWGKCEVATHTPENGTWESSGTFENSELDRKNQNTLHWNALYIVGKVLKCRCPKWPHISHLDICSTSYGRKEGRESNWQFDSRPLKVRNRFDPGVCKWSATHCWKALKESYKFTLNLIPIRGLNKKLWMPKVLRVQTKIVSRLRFGSPWKKCHSDASAAERHREYYMGEGGGFPRVQAVVNQVSPRLPMAWPNTKSVQNEF